MKVAPLLLLVGWSFFPPPPDGYRGNASAVVHFVTREQVAKLCRHSPNDRVMACASPENHVIILPNPCDWPLKDGYAELACHVNGWRH